MSSQFCSKCGTKLRADAKFCTTCGQKSRMDSHKTSFNQNITPSQSYSQRRSQPSTRPVIITQDQKQKRYSQQEDLKLNSAELNQILSTNPKNTLSELEKLENDIQTVEIELYKENELENSIKYSKNKLKELESLISLHLEFLTKEQRSVVYISNLTWSQFRNKLKDISKIKTIIELEIVVSTNIVNELTFEIEKFSNVDETSINYLKSLESKRKDLDKLKTSFKKIERSLFQNLTAIKKIDENVRNLSILQAKFVQLKNNIKLLDSCDLELTKIDNSINTIISELSKGDKNGIDNIFSDLRVIYSLNEEPIRRIISELTLIDISYENLKSNASMIYISGNMSIPKLNAFAIFSQIIQDYLFNNSLKESIEQNNLLKSLIQNSKNLIKEYRNLQTESFKLIMSNIKLEKDFIHKARQEILMNGHLRSRIPNINSSPIEKQQLNIIYEEIIFFNDPMTKINSLESSKSVVRLVDEKIENINKNNGLDDWKVKQYEFNNETASKYGISMISMPKLDSMKSSYMKNYSQLSNVSEENKFVKELEAIKYAFKKIRFDNEENKAEANFYTGSIKKIDWDYSGSSLVINVFWKFESKNTLDFNLSQETNRERYSWEKPYKNVKIKLEIDDKKFKDNLMREKRIAEKMNAIPGEVSVKVSNEVIIINTERKPSVIKPTLDFIKELVFILGISFRF